MEQPRMPVPQVVYGRVVYWLCIVAASISVIGPVLAVAFPDHTFMNPQYLFHAIWEGKSPEAVWQQAGGGSPGGHVWLSSLDTWDGVTQLGLVIGMAGAFLALLATSIAFLLERPRSYDWAMASLLISLTVLISAMGLL